MAGSLSFFITCLTINFMFNLNFKAGLITSIVGTFCEGYCRCLDNLLIPMIMVHTYALL